MKELHHTIPGLCIRNTNFQKTKLATLQGGRLENCSLYQTSARLSGKSRC